MEHLTAIIVTFLFFKFVIALNVTLILESDKILHLTTDFTQWMKHIVDWHLIASPVKIDI